MNDINPLMKTKFTCNEKCSLRKKITEKKAVIKSNKKT